MKGTAVVVKPDGIMLYVEFDCPPTLEWLQQQVAGYVELVPGFTHADVLDGRGMRKCAVLVNEEGKFRGLAINRTLTHLWDDCRRAHGYRGAMRDILVGTGVILLGDQEFIEAL